MIKGIGNDCESPNIKRVMFVCLGRRLVKYELCNAINSNTASHSFIHLFIHLFILPLTRNTSPSYRNTLKIIII